MITEANGKFFTVVIGFLLFYCSQVWAQDRCSPVFQVRSVQTDDEGKLTFSLQADRNLVPNRAMVRIVLLDDRPAFLVAYGKNAAARLILSENQSVQKNSELLRFPRRKTASRTTS